MEGPRAGKEEKKEPGIERGKEGVDLMIGR